ncbi:hypothetical protein AURDEDRAFT_184342 [Auricularia subglabra TFB-10046 SS5]|nr:hypothetical protein AURDEDRAFT_184342 [Auricularia subglabra TFB-10046 SS5]
MDRTPDEVLLQIFEHFSFDDLRLVLAVCSHWRGLGEQCRAFWSDIQTPRTASTRGGAPNIQPAPVALACRRITCTKGRLFTLRLKGVYPSLLSLAAQHMQHVEHLQVRLSRTEEFATLFECMCAVSAPSLRSLDLHDRVGYPGAVYCLCESPFAGGPSARLTRVRLSNVTLADDTPLAYFSGVRHVKYRQTHDFFSPEPPNFFVHFPALRSLSLDTPIRVDGRAFSDTELAVVRRFQGMDYSQLEYVELRGASGYLAQQTAWPLEPVRHILISVQTFTEFPFVPADAARCGHIVFARYRGHRTRCYLSWGNADWSISRTCLALALQVWNSAGSAGSYYHFNIHSTRDAEVRSASLPARLWKRCRVVLDRVRGLRALRIILGPGDALPTFGYERHIFCPDLRTLILRGEDAAIPVQLSRDAVVRFLTGDLGGLFFPLRLQLEGVELIGQGDGDFATYVNEVDAVDASAWSYLRVREIRRENEWPEI